MANNDLFQNRDIEKRIRGNFTSDGAGVKLKRIIGTPELNMLDPFLLLDEIHSDDSTEYISGFPNHPHRGFETVTYLLAGKIRHRDNATQREGIIKAGGVQWMTAGRGIIHSEIPEQENGLFWGFQLWINLPAKEKMNPPRYQEFDAELIPVEQRSEGVEVKVISGMTSTGVQGPVTGITTQPVFLDISLSADSEFSEKLPGEYNVFVYVYKGEVNIIDDHQSRKLLETGELAVLTDGEMIRIKNAGGHAGCLLVAARPLNEPVARGGPFVMNTRNEILQAFEDFNAGQF